MKKQEKNGKGDKISVKSKESRVLTCTHADGFERVRGGDVERAAVVDRDRVQETIEGVRRIGGTSPMGTIWGIWVSGVVVIAVEGVLRVVVVLWGNAVILLDQTVALQAYCDGVSQHP